MRILYRSFILSLGLILCWGLLAQVRAQNFPTLCNIPPANTPGATTVTTRTELSVACNGNPSSNVILLAPGNYTGDVTCNASGTAENPITIRAADPNNWPVLAGNEGADNGKWTIRGDHYRITEILNVKGAIQLEGKFGRITRTESRSATKEAGSNSDNLDRAIGVGGGGDNNRIDHNTIHTWMRRGLRVKTVEGTDNNRIDHNYLWDLTGREEDNGPSDPPKLNSGEALQVGSQADDLLYCGNPSGNNVYEYNFVTNATNDDEIISDKGSCTIWRYNRFEGGAGRISFRFPTRSTLQGNVFRNITHRRGVAILGRDHKVIENLFVNTNLNIESGNATSAQMERPGEKKWQEGGTLGCFPRAENTIVAHNTFQGSANNLRIGERATGGCGIHPHAHVKNTQLFNNQGHSLDTNFTGSGGPSEIINLSSYPGQSGNHYEVQVAEVGHQGQGDRFCDNIEPPPPPPEPEPLLARLNEPVHTTSTDPGAVVIDAAGCEAALESATPGSTYLMRAGTCNVDTLTISDINIFPNNLASVTIRSNGGGVIQVGSNTVIGGIRVDATTANVALGIDSDNFPGTVSNVTIQNNQIIGGVGNDLIRIKGAENVSIIGNTINGGGGVGSNDGNAVDISGGSKDVLLLTNLIRKNAEALTWPDFGTATGSLIEAHNTCSLRLVGNAFMDQPSVGKAPVALWSTDNSTGCNDTQFALNYFHGASIEPAAACLQMGNHPTLDGPGDESKFTATRNLFDRCGVAGARGAILIGEQSNHDNVSGAFALNLIHSHDDNIFALAMEDFSNVTMVHNTILDGRIEFNDVTNLANNTLGAFLNNVTIGVVWTGGTLNTTTVGGCANNNNRNSNSMPNACTNTSTTQADFEDCAFPDFACTPRDPTFLSELGTNGSIIGAFVPPVVKTTPPDEPEIGESSSTFLTINVDSLGASPPIAGLNLAKALVSFGGVSQTISNGILSGETASLIFANPPLETDAVLLTLSSGWCHDTLNLGNLDASLNDALGATITQVNADCAGVTNLAVTNNVQLGTNAIPVAVNDTATTDRGIVVTIDVLANDTDADTDPLVIHQFDSRTDQSQFIFPDDNGTPGILTDDKLTYVPTATFVGNDSFTYAVSDGNGGIDFGIVQVTVNAVAGVTGTYYVSDALGDDSRTFTEIQNPATPAKTIQYAIDAAAGDASCAGDTVEIAAGTYAEPLQITCAGSVVSEFNIRAAQGSQVTVDLATVSLGAGIGGVEIDSASEYVTIDGLRIENSHLAGAGHPCLVVKSGGANHITLKNLFLKGCGDGIKINSDSVDIALERVDIQDCRGSACIHVQRASQIDMQNVNIYNNTNQASQGRYIGIHLIGATDVLIDNARIEESCDGIVVVNNSTPFQASERIMVQESSVSKLGDTSCSNATAFTTEGTSSEVSFIGNLCDHSECVEIKDQATDIRHVHGTYLGHIELIPAGCFGASETVVGSGFEFANSVIAPTTGASFTQWNGAYSGSWSGSVLGSSNIFQGTIAWDNDGRQNGVLCPDPANLDFYNSSTGFATFLSSSGIWPNSIYASPRFKDIQAGDFQLNSTSPGIDAASCLLTVASAVADQTVVSVIGGSPLDYFVAPGTFFKRQSGVVARLLSNNTNANPIAIIDSMTDTTITFNTGVTLDAGDCITPRFFNGDAPDIGGVESAAPVEGTLRHMGIRRQ